MVTLLEPGPKSTFVPVKLLAAVSHCEASAPDVVATKADAPVMRQEKPPFTMIVTGVLELSAGWLPEKLTAPAAVMELFVQVGGLHPFGGDVTHGSHAPPGFENACHIR
jgi:hypothetical protein